MVSPLTPGTVFNQRGVVAANAASPTSSAGVFSQANAANPTSPASVFNQASSSSGVFPPPARIQTNPATPLGSYVSTPSTLSGSTAFQGPSTAVLGVAVLPVVAATDDSSPDMLSTSSPRPRSPRSSSRTRSSGSRRERSPSPVSRRTRLPTTLVSASDATGLSVSASNLASDLFSRGVALLDQIQVRDDDGNISEQFIKCITKCGDKVLILLDEGYLPSPDVEGTLSGSSIIIPYSLKTGVHQCSKSELCGVAFDCKGEICTLVRRNGSLEPREITFKIKDHPHRQLATGFIGGNDAYNAYPIIRWSEFWGVDGISGADLKAHTQMILRYIDVVSQRINAHISMSIDGLLEKTVDAAQDLRDKLVTIDREVYHSDGKGGRGLRQDLDSNIKKLRSFLDGYNKLDTMQPQDEANFKATMINLSHRKEYQRQLNSLIDNTVGYVDVINNISAQLDGVISQIAHLKSLNDSKLLE